MGVTGHDRDDVKVKGVDSGGTDREIGAVADGSKYRLCVDGGSDSSPGGMPFISDQLRYVDMNASNGGVARNTAITSTWTDIFSYSGSGLLFSFLVNLDTLANMEIRLIVDSNEIFGSSGISGVDVVSTALYGFADKSQWSQGIRRETSVFHWGGGAFNHPLKYDTSVTIKVRQPSGAKLFKAGLVVLTKET
jgi:hypothetical protein